MNFSSWAYREEPIERLVLLRMVVPLAVLGFMSSRLVHADHWIGDAGFCLPNLHGDWRQPMYFAPLAPPLAWALATMMVLAGLGMSVGLFFRTSSAIFAATLVYVALADRLSAFTVSKISPVIVLALLGSGAGSAYSVDAWRARARKVTLTRPERVGTIRFLQAFLCAFYCASGVAKMRGDWLSRGDVLWTQLGDSYQTQFSYTLANTLPGFAWTALQGATLAFEVLAPLWLSWSRSRPFALVYGIVMHAMIGAMFWPVRWFALLMMTLLVGAFMPQSSLERFFAWLARWRSRPAAVQST